MGVSAEAPARLAQISTCVHAACGNVLVVETDVWCFCLTGRSQLEGFNLNQPIKFTGVQVLPGDIA